MVPWEETENCFLCQEMLIITVRLGNCGKGTGNGSLEKGTSSYSQQGVALYLPLSLSCPLAVSIQHGVGRESWKYAISLNGIVL